MAELIPKIRKVRVKRQSKPKQDPDRYCEICGSTKQENLRDGFKMEDGKRVKKVVCKDYMVCANLLRY